MSLINSFLLLAGSLDLPTTASGCSLTRISHFVDGRGFACAINSNLIKICRLEGFQLKAWVFRAPTMGSCYYLIIKPALSNTNNQNANACITILQLKPTSYQHNHNSLNAQKTCIRILTSKSPVQLDIHHYIG